MEVTAVLSPQARPGNRNAVRHGADSPTEIGERSRVHRRRLLRRLKLRASDLDPMTGELIDLYARGLAVLDLREAGNVTESRDYWTAFANTRRCLDRLDRRLRELGLDQRAAEPHAALAALRRQP